MKITFGKYKGTELNNLDDLDYLAWGADNLSNLQWKKAFSRRHDEVKAKLRVRTETEIFNDLVADYEEEDGDYYKFVGHCEEEAKTIFARNQAMKQCAKLLKEYAEKMDVDEEKLEEIYSRFCNCGGRLEPIWFSSMKIYNLAVEFVTEYDNFFSISAENLF
jgi:hypothetical protein